MARNFFERGAKVWEKGPNNPVTEADLAVDALLKERLLGARPEYGWLSEETTDDGTRLTRKRVWIVDPIDGTRAFVRHEPEFAIAAGLVDDGVPVAGVVSNPVTGETFTACAGGRVRLNGGLAPLPNDCTLADGARILGSRRGIESTAGELGACEFFTVHSIAYRMALVSAGRYDAAIAMAPTSDWDIAAADVLIRAAGGRVTGRDGKTIVYNRDGVRHQGIIAAGAKLHRDIVRRFNATTVA